MKYQWQTIVEEGKVTEHSLCFGPILCRYWGDKEPPEARQLVELLNSFIIYGDSE